MTAVAIAALGMIGMIIAYSTGKQRTIALHQSFLSNAYANLVRRIDRATIP